MKIDKDAVIIICNFSSDPSPFLDNVLGSCEWCKKEIMHRPHTPKEAQIMCRVCAIEMFKQEKTSGFTVGYTKETAEEIQRIRKN